jgi:hypothetical protein
MKEDPPWAATGENDQEEKAHCVACPPWLASDTAIDAQSGGTPSSGAQ